MNRPVVFVCPQCKGPLITDRNRYHCNRCDETYDHANGLYRFVTRARQKTLAPFIAQYTAIRHGEHRGSEDLEYYLQLPNTPTHEWRMRARSASHLLQHIAAWRGARPASDIRILDIGAGNCWLTRLLAEQGYDVTACDVFDDDRDGLTAGRHYVEILKLDFARIVAHFDELPFPDASFDVVIFNASLHYSDDQLRTLTEALRVTANNGEVLINDSPMYTNHESGHQMQEVQRKYVAQFAAPGGEHVASSFLVQSDLRKWRDQLLIHITEEHVPYGLRHALQSIKTRLIGRREPASMKLLCISTLVK